MMTLEQIKKQLKLFADQSALSPTVFFKMKPGEYGAHDQFIGVSVPALRKMAKELISIKKSVLQDLIKSSINEERMLALLILVNQYAKGDVEQQEKCYAFYLKNIHQVNNWNLVDASAHLIIGAHLLNKPKKLLMELARSPNLWKRRISIVSTWQFIRNNQHDWTIKIAKQLLNDQEDLIHKATGWMLREVGKKDLAILIDFLNQHRMEMPRTMLRYAIERLPELERKKYLAKN